MKVVVNDANMIFTLLDSSLIDIFLKLNLQVWTSDFVIAEIEDTTQRRKIDKFIRDGEIRVYKFDSNELEEIYSLGESKSLSPADCSVYLLSRLKEAVLLSSDKALRNYARKNGLEVKGIIGVIEKLVSANLLEPNEAAEKLKYIAAHSMWLPDEEVAKAINKWRKAPYNY